MRSGAAQLVAADAPVALWQTGGKQAADTFAHGAGVALWAEA